jgi:hypothetical protein
MGSYTTNFLWNHPKPGDGIYDYSGGMINTPDTPETLNFTKNQPGFNFSNIFGMSRANADIPTDAERAAIDTSGIMGSYRPNMRDVSGEVGEYVNPSGFNLSNMDLNNPDKAIGPIMNFKDAPIEANEIAKGLYMNNPRVGPIDMWKNQGGDETTRFKFPSILGAVKGGLEFLGDKFGVPPMTQVSDADRIANQQFMQEQGIGIDNTGRMYGDPRIEGSQDFAGKNKPGASMFGSANFGEMAQKWDEEYGDMDYRTPKMIAKQKRIKAQAAEYAQKLEADRQERINNERTQANAANQATQRRAGRGGDHMSRSVSQGGLGISASQAQAVSDANRAAGMGGWGLAEGGRAGYRQGLLVDEDVNIEGPGFDVNENVMMASDPTINAELYGLYLDALDSNKIPANTTFEMFKDLMTEAQSQDQGIASMI